MMGVEHLHVIARHENGVTMLSIRKGWFWYKVYLTSPTDSWWLASFRYSDHAIEFVRVAAGMIAAEGDPSDEVQQ